jgi:hypothetical protein
MHIYTAYRTWKVQPSNQRALHAWNYEFLGTCNTRR